MSLPKLRVDDVAAYLLDRADQYDTSDWKWHPLVEAARALMRGEVHAALKHGELQDVELRRRVRGMAGLPGGDVRR